MARPVFYAFPIAAFLIVGVSNSTQALRMVPIDEPGIALSNAIKRAYRVKRTAKGLSYLRRGYRRRGKRGRRLSRAVRVARATGVISTLVFRNAADRLEIGRRLIYRIVIDRRVVRKAPGSPDGQWPAIHIARLSAGAHSVKLTVIDRRTRRRYAVYWGQVLASGGARLSITLSRCRVAARCRATLREGERILFGRP